MPQMMPLNWLTLMLFFLMIFLLFNIKNYYSFMYFNKSKNLENKTINLNWKW